MKGITRRHGPNGSNRTAAGKGRTRAMARVRYLGAVCLIATPLLVGVVAARTARERRARRHAHAVPRLAGPAVRGALAFAGGAMREPGVVLYLSAGCPHCEAEAARWTHVVVASPHLVRRVILAVVVPNPAGVSLGAKLVREMQHVSRAGVVVDGRGAIAGELGLDAVPYAMFVDRTGVARAELIGETSENLLVHYLEILAEEAGRSRAGGFPTHCDSPPSLGVYRAVAAERRYRRRAISIRQLRSDQQANAGGFPTLDASSEPRSGEGR